MPTTPGPDKAGGSRRPVPGNPGVSGTPLVAKLGVRAGAVVDLLGAPPGWRIPDLPDGADVCSVPAGRKARPTADVIVSFHRTAADLERRAPQAARALAPTSALWIAWPRRAGGHESDVTDTLLRALLLPVGVVDVKVAALDEDWSGLKFVWRKEGRAAG